MVMVILLPSTFLASFGFQKLFDILDVGCDSPRFLFVFYDAFCLFG